MSFSHTGRVLALLVLTALPLHAHAEGSATTIQQQIRSVLADARPSRTELRDLPRWRASLTSLYSRSDFEPLWLSRGHPTRQARQLLGELRAAELRGLLPGDYDGPQLAALATAVSTGGSPDGGAAVPGSGRAAAELDVALSLAASQLASDLNRGRVHPAEVGYDLDIPQGELDMPAVVAAIATSEDVHAALDALEPSLLHYRLLKAALARYEALARDPGLTRLPPLPRASVSAGENYEGAPALRRLLVALGDMPDRAGAPSDAARMDDDLTAALIRFQRRHGLDPDGVLGRATYRALTTPLSARVQQIELSLERIRWLPRTIDSPPIIVNVPQFRLFAFRTTQDVAANILQMDVIVGSAFRGRRTPVFAADMRYVVLSPYWDVPRSILVNELLPGIRAHPQWVTENGYEIVAGQGDEAVPVPATAQNVERLAQGRLRLRQKPGPDNALGRVKFMFPNRHNVYLHDTPARALFGRARRDFSHGCIRVAEPMALLAHVLRDEPAWTSERIEKALQTRRPVRIPLHRPIRVYILYGTALATEAGAMLFFEDIYDQDARLAALLQGRRARGGT